MTLTSEKSIPMGPMLVEPTFVERVWGMNDLRPWFDFVSGGEPIGEVWLSGDKCRIAEGSFAGLTLQDLFAAHGSGLLGPSAPDLASPLLIKVLFAQQKLSVQVHPDDKMAQKYGSPRGKTECWYALTAEPGAEVALGLKRGVTPSDIRRKIADQTLEDCLVAQPIATGQLIYVDAGTVHAIWPGSVLLETQQNCDITYRLYDYGRGRELHIEESLEALRTETAAGLVIPSQLADRVLLADKDYFRIEKLTVSGRRAGASLASPAEAAGLSHLFVESGTGRVTAAGGQSFQLEPRALAIVPATADEWWIEADAEMTLIRMLPRWP